MAFWTQSGGGTKDPKRGFRFQIQFDGYNTDQSGILWFAKKVSKPNFSVTEAKHAFLNHSFYFPGRVEWQEISMTLVDPVSPGAIAQTNAIIQASGYQIPANAQNLVSMSKAQANLATGVIVIRQMTAENEIIEEWTLKNPFIKTVKFGELSYEDDNLLEIELTLRYDWAECNLPEPYGADLTTIPNAEGVIDPNQFYKPQG